MAETKLTKGAEREILTRARKRFKAAVEAENKTRLSMLDDKKFLYIDHWPDKIRRAREADDRPCLQIDRLKPQIKQVTNQQRAMRPAVQVSPVDSGADPDVAEVLQGLIRHIEINSDADDAYDQAGRDQVETGLGWIRIRTEYCDDESGNQDVLIDRVRNPFSIYRDPSAQKRDCSDMKFAFEVSDLLPEEVEAQYGKKYAVSAAEFSSIGDDAPNWMIGEKIRVAKYWEVTTAREPKELEGGKSITVERRTVRCYVLTGLSVIESYDWPGKYIPLVPVLGEETDIEGEVTLSGITRGAKDPQRMLDYWKSATTETVALAPLAPFIVAEGQIEQYEQQWKQANRRRLPYLTYKPKTIGGELAPPPQRQQAEPPIQAMMALTQAGENDLRAVTGFYDVAERESREQSGRAILARQKQGEHGNSDYLDGLARAIRHVGRILIDLIPKIYDVPRVVRVLGLDSKPKTVMVHADNAPEADPTTGQPMLPPGVEGAYDVSVGKYDVVVKAGTAQTQREDFIEFMGQLFQAQPALFQAFGDLFFENLDEPHAKQMAERAKKMLPPILQDDPQNNPAAMQAQMGQMQQQMQLMQQALQQAQQQIATKQAELDSRERIAAAEIQHKERLAALEADVARVKAANEAKIAEMKMQVESARFVASEGRQAVETVLEHQHQTRQAERAAKQAIEPDQEA
jgi:hypothetical protein